jgi:hypothetical protein
MRRVVPDQFERAWILARNEFDPGIAIDRIAQIGEGIVKHHCCGALRQRRRNALGNVETGCAWGVFTACAVGEGQRDHQRLLAHSLPTNAGKRGTRYSRRIGWRN